MEVKPTQLRPKGWGAFNGQARRRELVHEILARLSIQACVETGTYLGETTAELVGWQYPVFTVELNKDRFAEVRDRFAGEPKVSTFGGDSRKFLQDLVSNPACPLQRVFFYLDAHWNVDVPLREEVIFIVRHWRRGVIMIDDFEVPDEPDYGFDCYPGVAELNRAYLAPAEHLGLSWFWPAAAPAQETGAKRGCAVLAWDDDTVSTLTELAELRRG